LVGRNGRKRHIDALPLPDDSVVGAVLPEDSTADAVAVRDVLDRLPPQQAKLLRLADLEGFRAVEIAAMSGVKEGTVRMALLRARAAFREAWTGDQQRGGDQ
jgi:RNA polymerase sigma factor (sigma-70 family)